MSNEGLGRLQGRCEEGAGWAHPWGKAFSPEQTLAAAWAGEQAGSPWAGKGKAMPSYHPQPRDRAWAQQQGGQAGGRPSPPQTWPKPAWLR